MVVDFEFRKSPALRLATVSWKGAWNEKRIRSEFEGLDKWMRAHKLRSGRWVFMEAGERRWKVGIELRGNGKGGGRVRVQTLPATRVACVDFDPEEVSARVVYHGLNDWLRWRKKDGDIHRVGGYRELYNGNPWKDARAWSHTCVQAVVR